MGASDSLSLGQHRDSRFHQPHIGGIDLTVDIYIVAEVRLIDGFAFMYLHFMGVGLIDHAVAGYIAEQQSHRGGCRGQIISLVVVNVRQADGDVAAITNNMAQIHDHSPRIATVDGAAVELATATARPSNGDNVVIESKDDRIESSCTLAAALNTGQRNIKTTELRRRIR